MNFQEIVIYVALVIMIIALIVVFMMLYYSSDKNQFPPIIGSCPDFWVINDRGEWLIMQILLGLGTTLHRSWVHQLLKNSVN